MVELEEIVDEPSVSAVADARVLASTVDESSSASEFRDVPNTLETESGSRGDSNSPSVSKSSAGEDGQGEARSVEPDRTGATTLVPDEERFEDALSEEDQIKVRED